MKFYVIYPASSFGDYPVCEKTFEEFINAHDIKITNFPPKESSKHDDFMKAINSETDVIIAWVGGRVGDDNSLGRSSIELVNSLSDDDWERIKKSGKKIVGCSDVSYLLCALLNDGIECYYGVNFLTSLMNSMNEEKDKTTDEILCYLKNALYSQNDYTINYQSYQAIAIESNISTKGKISGRLVGGNLDTIKELYAEKQIIKKISKIERKPNDIVFLEEIDPTYFIDDNAIGGSMKDGLEKLKGKGLFRNINGLILGRSKNPVNLIENKLIDNDTEAEYIKRILADLNLNDFPVIINFPCGHTRPTLTMPLGRTITLDIAKGTLTVHKRFNNAI